MQYEIKCVIYMYFIYITACYQIIFILQLIKKNIFLKKKILLLFTLLKIIFYIYIILLNKKYI